MTYGYISTIRVLFREFKKHKTVYQIVAEHGIYMSKPQFNAQKMQGLIDFMTNQA